MEQHHYRRFFIMLGVSFVVMYSVMYLNTYALDHVYFSLTRFYMTVLMITAMALVMLLFMQKMYTNKRHNALIIAGSISVFITALLMVRSQTFVHDTSWLKAMIPHHSIAIMVSKRATIQDPEVRQLADSIIVAQEREISQMKAMIQRLEQ
ncbi:DUF305 domain-containing protein [Hymenobacter lapidiphilus]|uniref:DUF305 domain-containing protein n=1 Tax=Hymenobacter lapidiphilus TaxID=2608003 RepID=A0A7Y7PRM2_9BACT|nr:DUF305 domain-containing protein [Hymenobacter lapidiphilus]NVO32770.1 DUF305 domain-containing protein [Hymenobacter lapidiphilus]